ncbi:MAG: glycosyltransferase, partial [Bacteroidetes bacterium]|nr:glycosyltransferase [Bacteroidota bacterium]
MELSVIITHHRELNLLKKCLPLIREEIKGMESEIIVILSEYQEETLSALKQEFNDVIFLPFEENLYFVRSINRGIERASGNYILLINDDVMVSPGSIRQLID